MNTMKHIMDKVQQIVDFSEKHPYEAGIGLIVAGSGISAVGTVLPAAGEVVCKTAGCVALGASTVALIGVYRGNDAMTKKAGKVAAQSAAVMAGGWVAMKTGKAAVVAGVGVMALGGALIATAAARDIKRKWFEKESPGAPASAVAAV